MLDLEGSTTVSSPSQDLAPGHKWELFSDFLWLLEHGSFPQFTLARGLVCPAPTCFLRYCDYLSITLQPSPTSPFWIWLGHLGLSSSWQEQDGALAPSYLLYLHALWGCSTLPSWVKEQVLPKVGKDGPDTHFADSDGLSYSAPV